MAERNGDSAEKGRVRMVCDEVWIDGPGDTTVRPASPERVEWLRKEREKVYGSPDPGPVPPEVLERALAENMVIDVWIDGPGDTTVRPASPERIEWLRKEREKVYGSPEPGLVPPEVLEELGDFQPPPKVDQPPNDSDKTRNG